VRVVIIIRSLRLTRHCHRIATTVIVVGVADAAFGARFCDEKIESIIIARYRACNRIDYLTDSITGVVDVLSGRVVCIRDFALDDQADRTDTSLRDRRDPRVRLT
jgi:hypothetical protein